MREGAELHFSLFGADLKRKFGLIGQDGVEFYCEAGPGRGDVQLGLSKEGLFLVAQQKQGKKISIHKAAGLLGQQGSTDGGGGSTRHVLRFLQSLGNSPGALQDLSHLDSLQS